MIGARIRILVYAGRLDRIKDRYRYLGNANPNTHEPARRAAARYAEIEQIVVDLRQLCATADVAATAKALVDAVTFDEAGMMVAGEWKGGNGGLLSRETIIAADNCRRALEARG